jgi:hypothetical protein
MILQLRQTVLLSVRLNLVLEYFGERENMLKSLWRNSGPRELPKEVKTTLESRYRLDPETLGRLRILERSGKYAGRSVLFIRIIDPTLLTTGPGSSLKYSALDNGNHSNAVQFDGHIEKSGLVVINDRRSRQGQAAGVGTR